MSFGRKLKELRLRADLTQTELAEAVGVDYTYLSKIENDRVEPPSEKVILKLAEVLQSRIGTEFDADELVAMAGKIPSSLMSELAKDPRRIRRVLKFLRSVSSEVNQHEDWHDIVDRENQEPSP